MEVKKEGKKDSVNLGRSTHRRKRIRRRRKKCQEILVESESCKKEKLASRSKWFEWIQKIAAIAVAMYPIVEYVFNYFYSEQCERFYYIPAKYFSKSINSSILYIALLVILLAVPIAVKWFITKGETNKLNFVWDGLITLCYGFALGYVNLLNLLKICSSENSGFWQWIYVQFSEHIYLFIGIVMGLSTITMMGSTMILLLKKVKFQFLQISITIVFLVSLITSAFILFNGTRCVLDPNPAGKSEYEIAVYMDSEYAIISEYEDKILVVPLVKDDKQTVSLDTNRYRFLERSECDFYFKDFGHVPEVLNENMQNQSP